MRGRSHSYYCFGFLYATKLKLDTTGRSTKLLCCGKRHSQAHQLPWRLVAAQSLALQVLLCSPVNSLLLQSFLYAILDPPMEKQLACLCTLCQYLAPISSAKKKVMLLGDSFIRQNTFMRVFMLQAKSFPSPGSTSRLRSLDQMQDLGFLLSLWLFTDLNFCLSL